MPTLLLSGDFDPITPPAFATQVAAGLSHAMLVTFPRGAHGQAFESPCANEIIESFLNNPTAALNLSCAATAPSNFVVPSDLIVLPQLRTAIAEGTQRGLMTYAFRFIMIVAGLVVLLTAIPVYAVVEVIACLRGRRALTGATFGTRLSAAAPWLPVLTLLLFTGFLAVFAAQLFATLDENKFLAFVGTVPRLAALGLRHRLAWRCGCRVDGCRHTCLVETAPAHLGGTDLLQLAISRRVAGDTGTLAGGLARRAL